jgi:DNA-directed RNA polymerase specialized sigma24 family protein
MKDYYKINNEIIICNTTIRHLRKKRERLFARATNTTSQLKQDITSGGSPGNAIELYVQKLIDEVETELTEKLEELKELLLSKQKIKEALKKIAENKNNDLERIFVYKYIDGKSEKEIARLMPCDLSTVYRKLKQIKRII